MALKIKVKTFILPIKTEDTDGNFEEEIENHIKNKIQDGYTLEQAMCNSGLIILIFKKE